MSAEDEALVPAGVLPIRIQAANAFGTGHHGTTHGCLQTVQYLNKRVRRGQARAFRIADVGCGTALLAFAAAKIMNPAARLWRVILMRGRFQQPLPTPRPIKWASRVDFFVARTCGIRVTVDIRVRSGVCQYFEWVVSGHGAAPFASGSPWRSLWC